MKSFVSFWQRGMNDIRELIINPLLGLSYYKKCFLLIVLGIGLFVPFMDPYNTTGDERATILLFSYPWKDMFRLIAIEDGHPPLYHAIYRLFQLGGDIHNVFPLRVATLCIFALTALLGVFPLRRLLGETAALFFIICVFFLPSSLWLSVNVRMYPLVVYVVSGTFIYSQLILFGNKKTDWLFFVVFTLAGLYTHYFGCIILAVVWSLIFVQFLLQKQYKKIACLAGAGLVVCLLYLPWLFVFFQQYNYMTKTWFPSDLDRDEAIFATVLVLRALGNPVLEFIFCFFGCFCWILIWEYLLAQKKDQNTIVTKNATIVFWGLFVSAFLISVFIRPTLITRYLIEYEKVSSNILVVVVYFLHIGLH